MKFRIKRINHHWNSRVIDHKGLRIRNPPDTDQVLTLYRVLSAISCLFLAATPRGRQGIFTTKAFQTSKTKPRGGGFTPKVSELITRGKEELNQGFWCPAPKCHHMLTRPSRLTLFNFWLSNLFGLSKVGLLGLALLGERATNHSPMPGTLSATMERTSRAMGPVLTTLPFSQLTPCLSNGHYFQKAPIANASRKMKTSKGLIFSWGTQEPFSSPVLWS